jgi:DNA-binding NarL/FixJ family response regulator
VAARGDGLTPREREVLALLARGASNRAIAEALVISEKTVEVHVSNILGKLGATSRTHAAALAREQGPAEAA